MSEEKKLNEEAVEIEEVLEATEETAEKEDSDTAEAAESEKKAKKEKAPKAKKPKKLKNQAFLKKGSYSLAITAAVIIGAIILNVLTAALSDRFILEFDMSKNADNSISKENIDYIKGVDKDIMIIVCASKENYTSYISYVAQAAFQVTDNAQYSQDDVPDTDYYKQSLTLIEKYGEYNKKIDVKFVDYYSTEFSAIKSTFNATELYPGDIIVAQGTYDDEKYDVKKYKTLGYKDIYSLYEDSNAAMYGMSAYNLAGNNIETAVTSAISYVQTDKIKKVGLITGHSNENYYSEYLNLLKDNNYEYTVIEDQIISKISDELDAVAIVAPNKDFSGAELDALSEFLDNNGKLNKGLMVFANASAPYLTNLYDFLNQWGIVMEDGVVYETEEQLIAIPDDNTTVLSISTQKDDLLSEINTCISSSNVPMYAGFESENGITVTSLTQTSETTVAAPKGSNSGWAGAKNATPKTYSTSILSTKSTYNDDNELIASKVAVFSSADFINVLSEFAANASNQPLTMAVTERSTGADDSGIVFTSKYIENESFASEITEKSANNMRLIFMWIIPLLTIAVSIFIYIRRKNA